MASCSHQASYHIKPTAFEVPSISRSGLFVRDREKISYFFVVTCCPFSTLSGDSEATRVTSPVEARVLRIVFIDLRTSPSLGGAQSFFGE